jgi:hypothetical protein
MAHDRREVYHRIHVLESRSQGIFVGKVSADYLEARVSAAR